MDVTVRITNLREFHNALRKLDARIAKDLRAGLKGIALKVAARAVPWIPKKSGAAVKSLRAVGTGSGAKITFGGNSAPYGPWLDFGGKVGRNKSIERKFVQKGRYVYEAISDGGPEALSDVQKLMRDIIVKEGWT